MVAKVNTDENVLIDDEFNDDGDDLEGLGEAEIKIQVVRQTWRDIEIQRELRMLEKQLGEKLDREIFN